MKKYIRICSVILSVMLVIAFISTVECFALRETYQQKISDDPKLEEANALYKKAITRIEDGDGVGESQRAAQLYDTAESYLTNTIAKLKELGKKNNIDVSKEVEFCVTLQKQTHEFSSRL